MVSIGAIRRWRLRLRTWGTRFAASGTGLPRANITKPHKVPVLEHLDRLSDAAALIGAVNCIVREDEHLVGENTDGKGFLQSLRGVVDPAGKRIVLLGGAERPARLPSNWRWPGRPRSRSSTARSSVVSRWSIA